MKKVILLCLMCVVVLAASAFARGGILLNVLQNAEQTVIEGKVVSLPVPYTGLQGQGMVIDTADGDINVYGLGPIWYWESNQVERPVVGETVTVKVYKLDINNKIYYILKEITLNNGKTLKLRDDSTNLPLWKGMKKGRMMGRGMRNMGRNMPDNSTCPFAN